MKKYAISTMETRLLIAFTGNPGKVLSRDLLINQCITPGNDVFDRTIDRQVSRLRNRLQMMLADVLLLDTVWGEGYRLVPAVEFHVPC